MQGEERLNKLREEIDAIDERIIQLLGKRFSAAREIAKVKKELGIDVLQPGRELEVIGRVRKAAKAAGISEDFAERLFREIMAESRSMQKQKQQNV
ncbi:chorismate mutase [Candidatus Woesearchaeota archaeon]|nr:chorismate mutase [Candidatus Woesearchaeota archaeon]